MGHTDRAAQQCAACQGAGQVVIGEHYVTQDMASDAGEPAMAGSFYGYEWGACDVCEGSGFVAETDRAALIAWAKAMAHTVAVIAGPRYDEDARELFDSGDVRALDAIAALLEAEAWQPIATAPKDGRLNGTRILATCAAWGGSFIVKWSRHRLSGAWTLDSGAIATDAPTHWRPLPAPPVTEAKA